LRYVALPDLESVADLELAEPSCREREKLWRNCQLISKLLPLAHDHGIRDSGLPSVGFDVVCQSSLQLGKGDGAMSLQERVRTLAAETLVGALAKSRDGRGVDLDIVPMENVIGHCAMRHFLLAALIRLLQEDADLVLLRIRQGRSLEGSRSARRFFSCHNSLSACSCSSVSSPSSCLSYNRRWVHGAFSEGRVSKSRCRVH